MKVIVLNGAGQLPSLKGKATFLNTDSGLLKETIRSLDAESQPFMLIWHEAPTVGLRILSSLRDEQKLPDGFRGCVFFRALRYAGLNTEEKARTYVKRLGFEGKVHIFSNIVSGDNPRADVLGRFETFVDVLRGMGEKDRLPPFWLLEPPTGEARQALARTALFLAQRLAATGGLPVDELLAAIDWQSTLKDAVPDPAGTWPAPAPVPSPEQLLKALGGSEVTLNCEPFCATCPPRSLLEHSHLKYGVVIPGTAVLKGKWPKGKPKPNDDIRKAASTIADRIEELLVSATENADIFRDKVVDLISPYLKQPSESFRRAASRLLHEEFMERCDLYFKRQELERGLTSLREFSTPPQHGEGGEHGEDDFLHELIPIANGLRLALQCSDADKAQVKQL